MFQKELKKKIMVIVYKKLPHCVFHIQTLYMDPYITLSYSYPRVKREAITISKQDWKHCF
jgi:hypothetical protein